MSRVLDNWLSAYQIYTEESESPESFHIWTGLSVMASALRRNVSVRQGFYTVYPNLYVILVGPSGKVAKSTAIRLGRDILYAAEGLKMGPDSITREDLIRFMARSEDANASGFKQSAVTLHSTELSSLIDPSGIRMVQFLTDIYDCDYKPEGWEYSTKTSGRDSIINPVLNILAGTTPSWIAEGMPTAVVEHGFTSRSIFVMEEDPRFANPRPAPPDGSVVKALKEDIQTISLLEGEVEWTEAAEEAYDEYYVDHIYGTEPEDHRISGFHWRKRIHVIKVAMLLSIAEDDNLTIEERDVKTAIELLKELEKNMPRTFSAVGKYEHAADLERIFKVILKEGGMSSQRFYETNYFAGEPEKLHSIINMLKNMGYIKVDKDASGEVYFLPATQTHPQDA